MLAEDLKSLVHHAETCFQRKDYDNALVCFTKITESAPTYAWAHAHMGETYFALAPSQRDTRDENYKQALRCFNKALGVIDDENEPPTLKLGNTYAPYAWALAHRGELLRTIGNLGSIPPWDEDDVFKEALRCFDKAIKLDDKYAWAYAHRAATHCSFRDGNYIQALKDLDYALKLMDYDYPWCYAYKAVANTLMHREHLAFYNLFTAVVQDSTILEDLISPARELKQQNLPLEMLYLEAIVQYNEVLKLSPNNEYRHAYIRYYHATVHKYSSAFAQFLPPLVDLKSAINEIGEEIEKLPDTTDMSGLQEKKANALAHLDELFNRYEKTLAEAISDARKELTKFGKNEPDVRYIRAGLYALENKGEEALKELEEVLHDKPELKDQARRDIAWYYLRSEPSFRRAIHS